MKTLIIEFQTSGHYPEYLKHVLTKINEKGIYEDFLIFVTPFLKPHLKPFINTPVYKSIQFFDKSLAIQYTKSENTKQMAKLIFEQLYCINKHYKFDHVLFLNLSLVLRNMNILNPFKKLPFSFSGVLMNSPYRIREKKPNSLLQIKRELPLKLLIKNKSCTEIFLLNDTKGVEFYKKWSGKIKFINDPVRINSPSQLDIYKYHNIKKEALSFIQIGKLGAYKGTLDIIEAIKKLQVEIKHKTHFLFIGRVNKDTENELENIKNLKQEVNLSLRNEFVTDEDFTAYLEQSHVILITNKNVENSSGIVNHCLANNKVVIAPDKGYYKEVFKNYKAIVNYDENFTLAEAIEFSYHHYETLASKAQKFDSKEFVKENSPDKFSEILLKTLQ